MKLHLAKTLLAAAALSAAVAQPAFAEEKTAPEGKVEAGVLRCDIAGGVGLIIGSSKGVKCTFEGTGGKTETYTGRIAKLGIDVGVTGEQKMVWRVFGPKGGDAASSMGGKYVGVSAGAAAGVAVGANALIGGSDKNFVLQPLSLQTGTGVNVAVGVASMRLEATN